VKKSVRGASDSWDMDIPVRFAGRVRQLGEDASRLTRHRFSLPVGGKKIISPGAIRPRSS
jgi:hypothetical protein